MALAWGSPAAPTGWGGGATIGAIPYMVASKCRGIRNVT